jgi:serine/threonine protein kinase/tetratricopeptide (TPR) repeat protein
MTEPALAQESIFLHALECASATERAAYLNRVCADKPELRAEVESLLRAHEQSGDILDLPEKPAVTIDAPMTERPATVIGPYKLLEQIGEGAFGVVFMAEQSHPIRRKVALKILKPGMDTKQVVARFEAERQALALMDHPNIAKVLDAGQTSSGRPYFVMDLVKGLPITEFCDQAKLPIRERLELFLSVCQAVQHAHQKGIIHRDIKPSNVLVTLHDGTPLAKVIDFGIAKALGQQLTDKTLYTGFAQLIGTPLYMSPEQAALSNIDVDTRSDIYSLGVLLYELLTGTTPFDMERLHQAGYDELRRIIREEEPAKPSTRISTMGQASTTISTQRKSEPKKLSQQCRGELDWIVMKCLEKDRNRRYETASALAADVQHYLREEPVTACPPSAWYRWRKFARRYRGALAMAAVVLVAAVLAVAGVAGSIGWAARDRAARDAALDATVNRDLDEAEAMLQSGNWPEGSAAIDRAAKLLQAAGQPQVPERLEQLQQDVAMAKRLEEIYSRPIDHVFFTFLEKNGAYFQDKTYFQAFQDYGIDMSELSVAEAAERIQRRSIRLELAQALDYWSSVRRGPAIHHAAKRAPDWSLLLEIAKAADPDPWRNRLREALQRDDRQTLKGMLESVDVRQMPPGNLALLGRTFGVTPARAVELLRQAQQQYPNDLAINIALGSWCFGLQHYDESARFYTAALALRPDSPYLLRCLGAALRAKGSFPEAMRAFSRALELRPDYEPALYGRAEIYLKHGQTDKALADLFKAIQLHHESGYAWTRLAWAYAQLRQWDKAVAAYTKGLEIRGPKAAQWAGLGEAYAHLGQWQEAIAAYSKYLDLCPAGRDFRYKRGYAYSVVGQWDKAVADLAPQGVNAESPNSDTWLQLACLRLLQDDVPGYRQLCQQLIESATQSEQGITGSTAYFVSRTCTMLPQRETDQAQVLVWAEKAVAADPKAPWCLHTLALAHYRAGHLDHTVRYCLESRKADPKWDGGMLNRLLQAMALVRQDQKDEAQKCLRPVAQWQQEVADGTYKGDAPCPPDKHLSDWLEFQVLWREAEKLFDKDELKPSNRN